MLLLLFFIIQWYKRGAAYRVVSCGVREVSDVTPHSM